MTTAEIFAAGKILTGPPGPKGEPGKQYVQRKPTLYEQGEFQRWLEQRAHDAVDRSSGTEESKDRRHHLLDIAAGLGKYDYDSPRGVEARWLPAGMVKVITMTMRDQGVTDEIAEYLVEQFLRGMVAEYAKKKKLDPERLALVHLSLGLPMEWTSSAESESSSTPSSARPSTEPLPNSEASMTTSSTTSTESAAAPMG